MKQGNTGLTVRELQHSHKPFVELTPKQVKSWVEQLPITNLGDSSQMVYKLLVSANSSLLEANKRYSILKILEPTVSNLVKALETQFINHHITLTEKQKKIAALAQAIQTELSLGYHAVIESILGEGVKRSSRKLLAQSICSAINYQSLIIFRCYQLYSTVPARVWREIYQAFQIALRYQIDNAEIPTENDKHLTTAKDYFIRVLLLSISNPYQLRQSEIELVWEMLSSYVEFSNLEAHGFTSYLFCINLNSNFPPVQKSLYKEIEGHETLKLSVASALDKIKVDLTQIIEAAKYSAKKAMICRHLIHSWSQSAQRNFARTKCNDPINVTIGLGATHYLLNNAITNKNKSLSDEEILGETSSADKLEAMEGSLKDATLSMVVGGRDREQIKANRNYLSTSAVTDKDVWAKLYQPQPTQNDEQVFETQPVLKKRSRDSIVKDSYKIQSCNLVNMSPGGYCIQISSNELPKHAQTGEIIAFIEEESYSQQWSIGIVRWVRRQVKGTFVQMGIQLLAPDVIPIDIQLRNSRTKDNTIHKGLLLPELSGMGQKATIITNPLGFKINNKIKVKENNLEYEVRLTKEINSSGSSKQFSFDKISISLTSLKPESSARTDEDDNEGIWDLI